VSSIGEVVEHLSTKLAPTMQRSLILNEKESEISLFGMTFQTLTKESSDPESISKVA